MKTTLNQIRQHSPCASGWAKLLRTLNKTQADDEEVTIPQILDSNGLDDALWCLRSVVGEDKKIRLYAVWCARQVQHLMTDPRSLTALETAEQFAEGLVTEGELDQALEAVWAARAARAAGEAAWEARAAGEAAWEARAAGEAGEAARAAQEKRLREICQ